MPTKETLHQYKINNEKAVELLKIDLITTKEIAERLNINYSMARNLVSNILGSNKYEFTILTSTDGKGWNKRYKIEYEHDKKSDEKLKNQWFNDLPKKVSRESLIDWFLHRANKGLTHKINDIGQLIKEAKNSGVEVYRQYSDGKVVFY